MPTVHGSVEKARSYATSSPMIEWQCCPGVVCGSGRRTGLDASTGIAVYRLSSFRHKDANGVHVVVDHDGTLRHAGNLSALEAFQ